MSKKDVQKDDREVIDFVKRNWESFGRIAYEMYVWVGRLALLLNVEDMLRGNLKLQNFDWVDLFDCTEEIEAQLKSYNPQNEVVIVREYPSGKWSCITISTPSGRLAPAAACEEFYRNAHGPLDFNWLMTNDHQSELDQQDADKHRAEVRASIGPAIQDLLRNLACNRDAFLAKGLGLDDLCLLD